MCTKLVGITARVKNGLAVNHAFLANSKVVTDFVVIIKGRSFTILILGLIGVEISKLAKIKIDFQAN